MFRNKYLLATLLAAATVTAHAAETDTTFDSVSSIQHRASTIVITGILVNDTVPTTYSFPSGGGGGVDERCDRLYGVMLTQPGVYTLTVTTTLSSGTPLPMPIFAGCRLQLK
jgi:hypothetical protein